ncbi:MAG TPA: hypothetical protein VJB12_04040 [Candidatus Nanoarchaeia archaeon]|nr:hypothetical protein [Candidatus Nanoarchaeia archaeon]
MPSENKFLETADRILREKPQMFEALMEYERTKRIRTKQRLNFTVDRDIASKFKKFCKDRGYNMSAKVEQAMARLME